MTFQSVFITGASSGLGRGLSLHYARSGATVFAVARRAEQLDELAAEAAGAPGRVIPLVLDVTDAEALVKAVHEAERQSGGALDLVIANAGIGEPTHGRNLDWRKVRRILDVNVLACCTTVAAALPAMVEKNRGTVVGMASLAALRGFPGNAAYCASKAAVSTFMESLRVDLKGTGVRALCIYPGFVKTELTAKVKGAMPFLMELDDAVSAMSRGIAAGKTRIAFPLPLSATVHLAAAFPNGLYEELAGRFSPKPRRKPAERKEE
jgi:short-subunit dehydrogenase